MLLILSELSPEPLHAQISRQIRARILSRELEGGQILPSLRALAREYRVAIVTVQRAYEDLEHEGLLVSHPGKGVFVVDHPEAATASMAVKRFSLAFTDLVRQGRAEGLAESEIRSIVEAIIDHQGGAS